MKLKNYLAIGTLVLLTSGCAMQPSPWTKDRYEHDYKVCHEQTKKVADMINLKLGNFLLRDIDRSVTENCMKSDFGWTDYRLDEVRDVGIQIDPTKI